MTGGVVIGGWEYVWAAYGITFTVLGGYAISLLYRVRPSKNRTDEEI